MADKERTKYVPMGMNMTLEEIADCMGITRERVRQIETKALRKLARQLRARGINPEDLFGDVVETPSRSSRIPSDS